jgi:hypothetical protein
VSFLHIGRYAKPAWGCFDYAKNNSKFMVKKLIVFPARFQKTL